MTEGYTALLDGAAWLDISSRGRIAVSGRDRTRLLHAIASNDVKKLQPGQGCYAFLLSPQGRIQADLLLFCFAGRFLIETEPELREKVMAHIRRYIVADRVELEDTGGQTGEISIEGPRSAAILASLGAPVPEIPYSHDAWEGSIVANGGITGQPGFRVFCAAEAVADLARRLGAAGAMSATPDDFRTVRIENGKPRYGEEIGDTALPPETRQTHAVSFTKGCYIGQEIVERIRARGHVNRTLQRIELPGTDPAAPGSTVDCEGKPAEIASSVYSPRLGKAIALAYVRE
jgi:tRNA-modifying protein YgfZ